MKAIFTLAALFGLPAVANAANAATAAAAHPVNTIAISMFVVFVGATLAITWWAARKNNSASDHYAAGGRITAWQNGFAIAGDYMSAASILGISALIFTSGYDGLIYSIGFIASWPVIVSLLAERLRNLGRYTFADVASFRLSQKPVRTLAACSSLVIVILYLISQIVGAGKLVELLFGLQYHVAVVVVGVLMVLYVFFGGMLATTWVQIIKAVLLLGGCAFMSFMVLRHVGFNLNALFREAASVHPKGPAIMSPGGLVSDPISAVSLGLALIFGTPGLPHILMRFFTVPDAKAARTSVLYATGLIGLGYIMIFVIGYGTIVFVGNDPAFHDVNGALLGGVNMVAIHLASAVGGSVFLGFISAVAFSTILAVVAGLALAGASAVSHDLYANVLRNGKATEKEELRVSKVTTLVLGVISIVLGIAFENQNIAFLVSLVFSIAASSNFPVLLLSLYWRGLTTRGTVIGGSLGLATAVVLMILSPTVWVKVLGNSHALFPYEYPALFSMAVSFVSIWFFSVTDRSAAGAEARGRFDAQLVRSETGLGALTTLAH